jgi:thiamine transporter ThiT
MSDQPVPQEDKPASEERKFEAKSAVAIFGAPISWVALFGALIGALALVPFLFYINGGGFMSAGMGVFGPLAGVMLGPWAGFVAGFIGGLIGMMISPASYPLGIVDVILSGALLPLVWGLMQPRYHKLLLVVYPLMALGMWLIPYHFPGAAGGFTPAQEPNWFLAINWVWVGLVAFLLGAPLAWRMFQSPNRTTSLIGLLFNMYLAAALWCMPWVFPWAWLLKYPYELAYASALIQWLNPIIVETIAASAIAFFLLRAARKGNLRVVPRSWLDGFKFQSPP